jgi:hypothetical protein
MRVCVHLRVCARELMQLRCEYDGAGRLVFRGPRLKMGLTEGVPRTVMPDHLGRCVRACSDTGGCLVICLVPAST